MLTLCVFALVILLLEGVFHADDEVTLVLDRADTLICFAFLGDFVLSLVRAPRKWRYLATWGWLDLLSALPSLDVARWGRIARIVRLSRVLRALRASRLLSRMLFRERVKSAALAAALVATVLIVGTSAAILRFEDLPESNIRTADDAVWWAFATITTVGYGDRYPVSGEGRFIAALLMTAGVGLFGALSAALAAWFLAPEEEATGSEVLALREEIQSLRALIEERLPPAM
jgi:voltage-gated potassium channel